MSRLIKRDCYLNKIISCKEDGQVKVITGIRRCGKSVLLFDLYKDYLLENGVKEEQIITFKLDVLSDAKYRNPITLNDEVHSRVDSKKKQYYLFIDEVQMSREVDNPYDKGGDKLTIYDMLNDLKNIDNLDVYVTGSNSKMLSSDIATEFRGRYDEIRVHPLSFKEFYSYYKGDKNEAFNEYAYYGGMPYCVKKKTDEEKVKYLTDLFNEVYIKDIVERKKIQRIDVLEAIINLLSSSIGSLTNPTRLTDSINSNLKLSKDNIVSNNTITSYISYLKDAFMFSEAKRYDVKGKNYLSFPMKYYSEDIGLRNARTGFRQIEMTHIMENIIYNELIIRGYEVDVGVIYTNDRNSKGSYTKKAREIDFVCKKGNKKYYVQSAYAMETNEKSESERLPLIKVDDSFTKIIVRHDIPKQFYDEAGILNINIIDFLLSDDVM